LGVGVFGAAPRLWHYILYFGASRLKTIGRVRTLVFLNDKTTFLFIYAILFIS